MQFDECTPYQTEGRLTSEDEARLSMELSLRWARRSRDEFERLGNPNALFGIVQGGMFEALRAESAQALARDGLSRLRHRRRQRRRAEGGDATHHGAHAGAAAGAQAALPDGRGHAGGSGRRRGLRHRHVRLRHADAQRAQRPPVHPLRRPAHPQRAPQVRRAADRRDLQLHRLPRLLARLSAPPRPLRRDARADAGQHPQPALLPEPDARDARGARRGPLCRLADAISRPIGPSASAKSATWVRPTRTATAA